MPHLVVAEVTATSKQSQRSNLIWTEVVHTAPARKQFPSVENLSLAFVSDRAELQGYRCETNHERFAHSGRRGNWEVVQLAQFSAGTSSQSTAPLPNPIRSILLNYAKERSGIREAGT